MYTVSKNLKNDSALSAAEGEFTGDGERREILNPGDFGNVRFLVTPNAPSVR